MLQALSAKMARYNLRYAMSNLQKSYESNYDEFSKDTWTKNISENLESLMGAWNPEVKDLPPEKVIRDFNSFVLSGKYKVYTVRTLAGSVSDLSEVNLKRFSTLINYYHFSLNKKPKEKKTFTFFLKCILEFFPEENNESSFQLERYKKEFIQSLSENWDLNISMQELWDELWDVFEYSSYQKYQDERICLIKARNKIDKGDFVLAKIYCDIGLRFNDFSKDIRLLRTKGIAHIKLKEFELALVQLNKVITLAPKDEHALSLIAEVKDALDQKKGADNKNLSKESSLVNPSASDSLKSDFKSEDVFQEAKDKEDSSQIDQESPDYEKRIDEEENKMDEYFYYNRGYKKSNLGDFQGAIADYSKAIEINPSFEDALYNRADSKYKLEDYLGAISDLSKLIEINPSDDQAYNNRGNAKESLEDYSGAIADYTKAIEINPNYAEAYSNRGIVKKNLGNFEEAIADYTKAIDINPNYAEAYYNSGLSKCELGDFEGEISDYTKAIEIDPIYIDAYLNRGVAKKNLGSFEEAIVDYTKAIEIDPTYKTAYINRGNAKRNLEDYAGAIADHTKAIEIDPTSTEAYLNRASAKVDLEDFEGTITDLKKAKELGSEMANERLNEIEEYLRDKEYSKSIRD